MRFPILMIIAGYEDGNDASSLWHDLVFKLALDALPEGEPLCSQPTISRLKNLADVMVLHWSPSLRLSGRLGKGASPR